MRRWIWVLVVLMGCQAANPPQPTSVRPEPDAPIAQPAETPTVQATAAGLRTPTVPSTPAPSVIQPEPDTPVLGDQLSIAKQWGRVDPATELQFRPLPPIGTTEPFWVSDLATDGAVQISATLLIQTPHLAMYVDTRDSASPARLQELAERFETEGVPLLRTWFDAAWPSEPITILHTSLSSAAGYYAIENRLPQSINRYSNEREMIVISSASLAGNQDSYLATLTHELQHLLHRRLEEAPATWFNEGMAMFSEYRLNPNNMGFTASFLNRPDTQLNNWASEPIASLGHYGAADLWLRYIDAHSNEGLPAAALISADAGDRLEEFVAPIQQRYPDLVTFDDIFATWAVANLVNDPSIDDGRYGYGGLPETISPTQASESASGTTNQLGTDYLLWEPVDYPRTIEWTGAMTVPILPVDNLVAPFWWSGRGDLRASTLTASLAVPPQGTTLRYRAWTDLEDHFDYAYLTVSTDNGATWQPIPTPLSSDTNPYDLNLDHGWTGQANWETIAIDLSPWKNQAIQLRFWMISDQAYQANGVALDDLQIEGLDVPWQSSGWEETNNQLTQEWELRGILEGPTTRVEILDVDRGHTTWTIPANERAILVIAATTAETTQPAPWSYRVR